MQSDCNSGSTTHRTAVRLVLTPPSALPCSHSASGQREFGVWGRENRHARARAAPYLGLGSNVPCVCAMHRAAPSTPVRRPAARPSASLTARPPSSGLIGCCFRCFCCCLPSRSRRFARFDDDEPSAAFRERMKRLQVGIDMSANAKSSMKSLEARAGSEMLSVGLPDSPSVLTSTKRASLDFSDSAPSTTGRAAVRS